MEQIKFLDRFVRIYGIQGLGDYQTKITSSQYKNKQFLDQVNLEMVQIKKLFKTSLLNLARKNYVIDSSSLALNLLKNCLQQANVPFEVVRSSQNNFLRLNQVNKTLVDYINKPVEDIFREMEDIDYKTQIGGETRESGIKVEEVGVEEIGNQEVAMLFKNAPIGVLKPLDFSECLVEKVVISNNLLPIGVGTSCSDMLRVMVHIPDQHRAYCTDECLVHSIFDLVQETDQHWIVEIPFMRGCDFIYQMCDPNYLRQIPMNQSNKSYLVSQINYNNTIDRYCLRIGSEVIPISLTETHEIKNCLNLVACQIADACLQLYYKKSQVMTSEFLNLSLMFKYGAGYLQTEFRRRSAVSKVFSKQANQSVQIAENNRLKHPMTGYETFLFRGTSEIKFYIRRIHDFVVENHFYVKNLVGEVFTNLISSVMLSIGGHDMILKKNLASEKISFTDPIPDGYGLKYHSVIFKISLFQPLLDDQVICVEQKYVDLSWDQKLAMNKVSWMAKYGNDLAVLYKDGFSKEINPEQLAESLPVAFLNSITFDQDVIFKGKPVSNLEKRD